MRNVYELALKGILPEYAGMPVWAAFLARITGERWEDVIGFIWTHQECGILESEPKEKFPNVEDTKGPVISRENFIKYLDYRRELPSIWAHYLQPHNQPTVKAAPEVNVLQSANPMGHSVKITLQEAGRYNAKLQHADRNRL